MLESALAAGLMERGLDVLLVGVVPTPAVAMLTRHFGAGLGIVISASHNPAEDNGIKLFSGTGFKLPRETEREIEHLVREIPSIPEGAPPRIGRLVMPDERPDRIYLEGLLSRAGRPAPLENWRLVLDCAHGATSTVAPELFRRLGAQVTVLCAEPDGENINQDCGSEHPQALRDQVLLQKADAGIAFDGDGDRAIMVDEQGNLLDGDHILHILGRDLDSRGQLRQRTVVGTVMSNLGMERSLASLGLRLERVPVGDRHIVRRLLDGDMNLGGEPAGHIILLGESSTSGDGMYTAMKTLGVAVRQKKPLSALAATWQKFPQILINVPVGSRPPLESLPEVRQAQDRVQERLGDRVRVLLRYSGTQDLARVMVEGEEELEVHQAARLLADAVRLAIPAPEGEETALSTPD
jgi:phosphoglucosamine mutase